MQSTHKDIVAHLKAHGSFNIGSRGSPLAVAQADLVAKGLIKAHGAIDEMLARKIFTTRGDRFTAQPLSELGGKGLFTKEVDAATLDGSIDVGVHSCKDMPLALPDGLRIVAVLPREHPADVLISNGNLPIDQLAKKAVIGTSSVRRAAMIRYHFPHLDIQPLRGNVGTRLKAVHHGALDGTLLARAGLERLGQTDAISQTLDIRDFIPAPGQGVVAMVIRDDDDLSAALLTPLHDEKAFIALQAERGVLRALGGNCHTPLGAHAWFEGANLYIQAALYHPDGSARFADQTIIEHADEQSAHTAGIKIGEKIAHIAGDEILQLIQQGAA